MAAISRSRRSASGVALIIAGALFVIGLLLPLLGYAIPWFLLLAYAALMVAYAVLGIGGVNNNIAKGTLIAAAVGFAVLVIAGLGVSLPQFVSTIAYLVAGICGLIAAIVLYIGKEIRNVAALVFVIATALLLLYFLGVVGPLAFGTFALVIGLGVGAAYIVAGVLFWQKERRR
ncbi:MAG: hypothetical protein KF727_09870 [Microbacteriaceae bacterium]|nr:hypothetical protein [Microbacteriaceae bacterium]